MNPILEHRNYVTFQIEKSFGVENAIEKARSGVYADTAENRQLGRVGQEYGKKKIKDNLNADDKKDKVSGYGKHTIGKWKTGDASDEDLAAYIITALKNPKSSDHRLLKEAKKELKQRFIGQKVRLDDGEIGTITFIGDEGGLFGISITKNKKLLYGNYFPSFWKQILNGDLEFVE